MYTHMHTEQTPWAMTKIVAPQISVLVAGASHMRSLRAAGNYRTDTKMAMELRAAGRRRSQVQPWHGAGGSSEQQSTILRYAGYWLLRLHAQVQGPTWTVFWRILHENAKTQRKQQHFHSRCRKRCHAANKRRHESLSVVKQQVSTGEKRRWKDGAFENGHVGWPKKAVQDT